MWRCSCLCVLFGVGVFTTTHTSSAQEEENLALGGQTVQSSTGGNGEAAKAIDTSPSTCTHTVPTTDNPWWRVDLLDSYYISRVFITNRPDCCGDRLEGAEIRIGNSLENNGNDNPRCAVLYGVATGQSISVSCGDMNGRYVNFIIPGSSKILTLCDVQVYSTKVRKGVMKIKLTSSLNMSDPTESNKVLNEMKTTVISKGFSVFTLTWTKLPQKVKPETKLGPCTNANF
ncbi:fucolectin-like [Paramisgurnus dabryanus]|uniref:fucolectin-like n=1 Tax=Paramisgurnus dabryanus TaxID=90735 RepID=UPI0031F41AEB